MPVLGITGGIATGKSTFVRELVHHLTAEVFDADGAAHELLAGDESVRAAVRREFGARAFPNDGPPDRSFLRDAVFGNAARRAALEAILHPAIRARWMSLAAERAGRPGWLLVDLPLLYETAAQEHFARVVVVGCSSATQLRRLKEERGLEETLSKNIIGAQHDLGFKLSAADHVIWNDSTVACLSGQAGLLAGWLRKYYG